MIKHTTNIRVRYSETDQMGYSYYGNYALYYEIGRVELIRSLGVTYKELEKQNYILPVLSLQSNYHFPAQYDDELKIKTILLKKPLVKIQFSYVITNQNEELINTGKTTLAFLHKDTKKPRKAPPVLLKAIEYFF